MKILFLIFFTAFLKRKINTLSSDGCWNITENVRYERFLDYYPFETIDACLDRCLSLPQCSVVNINKKEKKCLVQKEIFKANETALVQDELVTNFFLKQRCKRYPSIDMNCWAIRQKGFYAGLTSMPFYNLFSCLSFCAGMPLCGAVNFDDRFVHPCWAQDRHFKIQRHSVKPSKSITVYFLNRKCLGTATYIIPQYLQPCWIQTPKSNYEGLKGYERDEVGSCSSLCARNPYCQTFNFDVARSVNCWVQEKFGEFDIQNLKRHETAINYVLDRSCFDREYPGEHSCWRKSVDSHYFGHTLEPTRYHDVYSCLAYCKLYPQCEIMQINLYSKVKCWIQKGLFVPKLSAFRPVKGVTNFLLDKRCYNETFGVDLFCWQLNNRFSYLNDQAEKINAKNVMECLKKCRSHEKCHIVDFYFSPNQNCWLQTEYSAFNPQNIKPNNSSLNFVLKQICNKKDTNAE